MERLAWFVIQHPAQVIEAYTEDGSLHEAICREIERLNTRVDVLEAPAQNYNSILARAEKAEAFLERAGYRQCDIAACNCGSWHQHSDQVERLRAALEYQAAAAHEAVRALSNMRAEVDRINQQFWKNHEADMCGESMEEADGKGRPCTLLLGHVGSHQDICIGRRTPSER